MDELIKLRKKIEQEIFDIECADRLRPNERIQLHKLYNKLHAINYQIENKESK